MAIFGTIITSAPSTTHRNNDKKSTDLSLYNLDP
jgi:hypothetical protein